MGLQQSVRRPRPIVGWDEEDVYTLWRNRYCYTQRAGVVKKVKRVTHKRERREGRAEISEELNDDDRL
jgi:hypothetical protein